MYDREPTKRRQESYGEKKARFKAKADQRTQAIINSINDSGLLQAHKEEIYELVIQKLQER